MVSSGVGMDHDELVQALLDMKREHGDDPEYQELRQPLPADWPI